jgi:ribosomal protein L16/L10AE
LDDGLRMGVGNPVGLAARICFGQRQYKIDYKASLETTYEMCLGVLAQHKLPEFAGLDELSKVTGQHSESGELEELG